MERTRSRRTDALSLLVLSAWLVGLMGCSGPRRPTPTVFGIDDSVAESSSRPASPAAARSVEPGASPRQFVVGHSREHRPIIAYEFGDGPTVTLIIAAIHGDEPIAAELADRFVQHLRTVPSGQLDGRVLVIPRLNPDGLARRTRANAAGVDLNRNFPAKNWRRTSSRSSTFGGSKPLSEPEAQVVARLLDERRPRRLISIHAMHRGACNNFDGPGEALAERMKRHNGYPVLASIGYPTPGSLGSFAGNDRQVAMVTLELPKSAAIAAVWPANRDALMDLVGGEQASSTR